MSTWTPFPHTGAYAFDADRLKKKWHRLHRGDCEPWPKDPAVLHAWTLFHNGEFEQAAEAGLTAGGDGITVANKATCMYANYLESSEKVRMELLMETALRAQAQQASVPKNANAWYWQAYALSRYSQGMSVNKALAQGLGNQVKTALEQTIELAPLHADAYMMLGAFHADLIDKMGILIAAMTCGAKKDMGLSLFKQALQLNPFSAIVMAEYAQGLLMLQGDEAMQEASQLYEQAAACQPVDAMERLNEEVVKLELQD
jgi:tetratricopeptide (TPR) repeat protein